ncbi:SLAP domain-containing protein [Lactobacillus sp. ESL0791]|uniref:SLAP domain-containing protein n=1 Tax=Lactobacillus sp. ESL0791 TaxID=2983234 RepID=UPI0023FA2BAC|nr:SLAP domain-containing protein [Lactobacillus sp. ESL0791]MDF7639622.1 SLAP domain-containing protein [Lactobacillus sp. ESL0791]
MIGKNNLNERLHKTMMENKNDHFSIRKLAIGAVSVLLGFSFMAANGQMAKADTAEPSGQASSTNTNKQGTESTTISKDQKTATDAGNNAKADVTTYSGLHSFLRDDTEQTQTNKIAAKSEQKEDSNEQGSESAVDLANAASDLQIEIGKGHNFVTTTAYQQATADKQQAVTDAISQGQVVLDKYNNFVATNDEASKVSLFDLTDAKITIGAMITAATNTVSAQDLFNHWNLEYSGDTLTITGVGGTDKKNGSGILADSVNVNPEIKKIVIGSEITLDNHTAGSNGMFGGLTNVETITGLDKVNVPSGAALTGLFANDAALKELDLTNFSMAGADTFTGMFLNTGIAKDFKLSLRGMQFPSAADAGLGTNRGYIKRVSDGQVLTTSQLQDAYNSGGPTDSYIMSNAASDTDTYTPEELQIDLVNHQTKVDPNAYDKLKFTDSSSNEVTAQVLKGNGVISSIDWVADKQFSSSSTIYSRTEDELENVEGDVIKSVLIDNTGNINGYYIDLNDANKGTNTNDPSNPVTFTNGLQGLVKVSYTDGSFVYVHVNFIVKEARPSTSDKWKAFNSSLDPISQGTVPETKFGTDSALASYVDLNEISPDQVDYYTVSSNVPQKDSFDNDIIDNNNNKVYADLNATWHGIDSDVDYPVHAMVRIHYKNGGIQDFDVPDFKIQSMAKSSPAKNGFNLKGIYSGESPISVLDGIIKNLKAEPDAANIDFNTIEWNGNPTFSPDSKPASFKIGYKDGSQNNNVAVNANVRPTPPTSHADQLVKEITQGRQTVAEIEIPQYSDLVNDQTLAANVALGTNLPKGTTFAWDQSKLPDTYTKGTKATAFVIVTSPDGSVANIPVNVTIGDPITQDIKLKHNAYLYNEYGERANGISLKTGSIVTVYGTRVIDGRKFYLTKDAAYYIAAGNDKPVIRKLNKNAMTYNIKGKKVVSAKRFKGEQIQTYGIPVVIKGKEYYAIGHRRYMRKVNFPPTPEWVVPRLTKQDLADGVVQRQLKKNAFVYTDKLDRANEVVLSAGSIIQTRGTKTIGNQQYYDLGNNMYVDVRNVKRG